MAAIRRYNYYNRINESRFLWQLRNMQCSAPISKHLVFVFSYGDCRWNGFHRLSYALSKNCQERLLVSSCLSLCPSIDPFEWNNSTPTERNHEFSYSSVFFRKSVGKIQASLKSYKNNRYLTWRPVHIYHISVNSSLSEMLQTKIVGKNRNKYFIFTKVSPKFVPFTR